MDNKFEASQAPDHDEAHERSRAYDLQSEEDPEDAELAREVENAIAEFRNPTAKQQSTKVEPVPESELLQLCAKDLERLKQVGSCVQGEVKVEYQPPQLKFSEEVLLEELKREAERPKPEETAQVSESVAKEVPAAEAMSMAPPPKTAQPPPAAVRKARDNQRRAQENKRREEEMKRMLEEMNMMEEDELSRKFMKAELQKRFGPYVQPLGSCVLLDFVATGKFSQSHFVPQTQKLNTTDSDEAFMKYGIQPPTRISIKLIQDLFVPVVEKEKPKEEKKVENPVPSISSWFKKLEDRKCVPAPDIVLKTEKPRVTCSVLKISIDTTKAEPCWTEQLVSSSIWENSAKIPAACPASFPSFVKDTFYRIDKIVGNSGKASGNKKKEEKKVANPSLDPEEQKQMAELNDMCALDELRLLDTLPENAEEVEIKLEANLDLKQLSKFAKVKKLVLPMNAVTSLESLSSLKTLREVYISQNKIARLDAAAFRQLEELRVLQLDVNLLERIEGLDSCRKLEVLKLDNNRIRRIEGLDKCTSLTHLHLYRNQIVQISGLDALANLQHLDLGRNKIRSAEYLDSPTICPMLTELLLYYNEITEFPANFSKPLLRSLWLNGNKLQHFAVGWCPLLESLYVSENVLATLGSFRLAQSLHNLDISFNCLKDIVPLLESFRHNKSLKMLKFNDNPFEKGREGSLTPYIVRLLPQLAEINSESVKPLPGSCAPTSESAPCHCRSCAKVAHLLQYCALAISEQMFVSRIVKGDKFRTKEDRVSFHGGSPAAAYFLRHVNALHLNTMLGMQKSADSAEYFLITDTVSMHRNACMACRREKEAGRKIISRLFLRKRMEDRVRLRKYRKHEKKLVKIQAWIRGAQTRKLYESLFGNLAIHRRKKRKSKDQMAIRIQAAARGFLFRRKIKRGLENAKKHKLELDDCPEIDVDNFLGMKAPPDHDDLIQIPDQVQLNALLQSIREPRKVPAAPPPESSSMLPTIPTKSNPAVRRSTSKAQMREAVQEEDKDLCLPELPLNSKNLNMLPKDAAGSKKHPTGSEISEYELRSEAGRSERSSKFSSSKEKMSKQVDNYIAEERRKLVQERTEVQDKTKKFVEDWGFKDPNTKKVVELRMNKLVKRKQKKQVLTAEQKYQRFLAMKQMTSKVVPGNQQYHQYLSDIRMIVQSRLRLLLFSAQIRCQTAGSSCT